MSLRIVRRQKLWDREQLSSRIFTIPAKRIDIRSKKIEANRKRISTILK